MFLGLFSFVLVAAVLVTLIEGPKKDVGSFFDMPPASLYRAVTTVCHDTCFVTRRPPPCQSSWTPTESGSTPSPSS